MDIIYCGSMMFTSLSSFALALFLKAEEDQRLTRAWRSFLLSIAFWSLCRGLMNLSGSAGVALFWLRASYMFSIWMPLLFVWLSYCVAQRAVPLRIFLPVAAVSLGLTFSNFSSLLVAGVRPIMSFRFYDVPGGIAFDLFSNLYTGVLVWGHAVLYKEMKKSSGLQRNRIKYFFLSGVVAFAASATTFPLVHGIKMYPFGVPVFMVYPMILSYAILKLQVMDVYLLLRDTTVNLISSCAMAAVTLLLLAHLNTVVAYRVGIVVLAIMLPVFYPHVNRWVRKNINRTRLGDVDRYLDDIEERAVSLIGTNLSLQSLSSAAMELVLSVFPVDSAAVYLLKSKKKSLHLYAESAVENAPVDLMDDGPVVKYLVNHRGLFYAPKATELNRSGTKELLDFCRVTNAQVLSPIHVAGDLVGLLVLGPKNSGAPFHSKDLGAINVVSKKLGVACSYASTAEKYTVAMVNWTHSLNQITKPIEMAAGMIKELDDLLSPEERKEKAEIIIRRTMQLREVHEYIANSSNIAQEVVTGEYRKERVKLGDIVRSTAEPFRKENKDVILIDVRDEGTEGYVNKTSIERAIYETVFNAIRHTKGLVEHPMIKVSGEIVGNAYRISVKDNGEGIEPANLDRIWETGWQQKDMNSGASGLGLSICRQIIEAHGGSIAASSAGKGLGMEIAFVIPLTQAQETEERNNGAANH